MRLLIAILVLLAGSSKAFATPDDGIYATQNPFEPGGSFTDRPEFIQQYLTIQELEDGTIVLLLLDTSDSQWQAFTGFTEGEGYRFIDVYSQKDYGVEIESEEIYIEFSEPGVGMVTHVFVIEEANWPWFNIPYPSDGKVEYVVDQPILKMNSEN